MLTHTLQVSPELYAYTRAHSSPVPEVLQHLEQTNATLGAYAELQVPDMAGQLLKLLVQLSGARRVVEVGVFTGYSSTNIALALPADGRLYAFDISKEAGEMAQKYWAAAGVAEKVDFQLRPAVESMQALLDEGHAGTIDMVFIDADKGNYVTYYELAMKLLRQGGFIVLDNTLWYGNVIKQDDTSSDTQAIRAVNKHVAADARTECLMLPLADGMTIVRKL